MLSNILTDHLYLTKYYISLIPQHILSSKSLNKMAQLDTFSDLTKQSDNILHKNFSFSHSLALSLYSKLESFSFKSSLKSSPDSKSSSLVHFQYEGGNLLIKQEISTNPPPKVENPSNLKSSIEYTWESRPELKTKLELDSGSGYQKNTFSAEVSKPSNRWKFAFSDDAVLKFSGVFGKKEMGAGLDLTYDFGPVRFTSYNLAAWLSNDRWRSVLKHESVDSMNYSLGNVVASVYFRDFHSWAVGVNAKFNLTSKSREVVVASQNQFDDNNLIKTRVGLDGQLAIALRSRVGSYVQVVTAIEFKPCQKDSDVKYGVRVKLNQ